MKKIWIISLTFLVFACTLPKSDAQTAGKDPFLLIAQGLLQALNTNAFNNKEKGKNRSGNTIKVAIIPFQKDKIPISKNIADGYNDRILSLLIKNKKGRIKFIARNGLGAIIDDQLQTGALDAGDDPIDTLLARARDIDILIIGKIRSVERGILLDYKAIKTNGVILHQTKSVVLTLKELQKTRVDDLLTIDQAVSGATEVFSNIVNDITELKVGGLYYQNTGIQTPFGIFFRDRIISSLQTATYNVLTENKFKVIDAESSTTTRSNDKGSYLFKGKYWILGPNLEIQLTLNNSQSGGVSWTGRIPISLIKRLRYKPSRNFEHLRENDGLGAFEFELTSAKGFNPIYRIGEKMKINIRTANDAWLYCFYHQADGNIIQIFPNPHFWKKHKSPRLASGIDHSFPDPKLFPFGLDVRKPIGTELIKCFAANRDVTKELPQKLRGKSLEPMAKNSLDNLSELFRTLPRTSISEASLVVTVVK
jgi:hypothetical protein